MPNNKTTHIIWPKHIDQSFRQAYLDMTGELIRKPTRQNMAESHNLIGSLRVLPEHVKQLKAQFPDIDIHENMPSDWVDYVHPEMRDHIQG